MTFLALALSFSTWTFALADTPSVSSPAAKREAERLNALPAVTPKGKARVDHSGRKERGKASYYARKFSGRTMADGRKMNLKDNIAASKTLPLGSIAEITNLETGDSVTVKVQDRGPFVAGRVIDVSPKVADDLALKKDGVAQVEVRPITVPQPDGSVKLGAGAAEATPREIERAIATTRALMRRGEGERTASAQ
ncbi:MAG: septal ring lytic transglycosylase RlpA family protein [Acetobacteraceae bacterium]